MKLNRTTLVILAIILAPALGLALAKVATVKVNVRVDSQAGGYEGNKAMDGNPQSMWHTEFGSGHLTHPHEIVVDLGKSYEISGIVHRARPGATNGAIKNYECYISQSATKFGKPVAKGTFKKTDAEQEVKFPKKVRGRYVRLRALSEWTGKPWTSIAELRILSEGVVFRAAGRSGRVAVARPGAVATPKTEPEWQYNALLRDLRNRARFAKFAPQTLRREASILESDRDPADIVLRRTAALLADIKKMPSAPDLSAQAKELAQLKAAGTETDVKDTKARYALYEKAYKLRRKIAFSNPLLNFDKILFIKRHRPTYNHMCDQYYGINSVPGGGVYVLSDPFGPNQKVRDVLADSVVERGRLKGKKLNTGSFVSPDLSYDGKTILFAYVECDGDKKHRRHTDPARGHWFEGRSLHVFKVNVGGKGLEQLTDGTWNDFDPCWLPNGRVAFISERRGGYLRCGRVCPTYTLYDMKADGSDIRCLSFHETNEWHPSVTHDGMIIYTRWDYVDRHGQVVHLPWVTTPDGRDSRAVHGNFATRSLRPDMELDVRAIPGSRKYTATAAPHHGQAFGSLILINPRIEDDDAMAPVKRITPDVGFPESQGGAQVYATAWPLSDDYYLCVYDASMRPGMGYQGRKHIRGNYGIYLLDAFGNKELIYRDPAIACQSPMPLRRRPRPPIVPNASVRAAADKPAEATLGVINVYDSLKAWPEGTKIKALRVYQILPMSVPSGGPPHEIGLRVPSGLDSVILARNVLGTVPVEKDGSAHFIVPARKELFFQALDGKGLAVQSMRSATYLQPGERLICQGCHEHRYRAPPQPKSLAIALRREPSRLKPDVDGSNPFSYPRLVQPVLEKHCVKCHQKNAAKKAPDLSRKVIPRGRNKWYASYWSLAQKYGFYRYGGRNWQDPKWYRTTPGEFGARASKLYAILTTGSHKDRVKLPDEDLHRITLWLDSCSIFYGVYEKEGGEAQLRGEIVKPTLE